MSTRDFHRVHVITGGFPAGSLAGHDMDYARHRILALLQEFPGVRATVGNDYADLERWLPEADLLITYVAGPFADDRQAERLEGWMAGGGRWLALHGTSGGKAVKVARPEGTAKQMVKARHHATLGCFFLNHPPIRRFAVAVTDPDHPLTRGLPPRFEVADELYLVELQDPDATRILLTTELDRDPSPPGFGFVYDEDTARLADGRTRVLGYEKPVGAGAVAYVALGHCHHPQSNPRPVLDPSLAAQGASPSPFRGAWEQDALPALVRNGIRWGTGTA